MSFNVTVVTPWRDGMRHMSTYMDRIKALDWPRDNLRIVHVEGDSTDGTCSALRWWADADSHQSVVKCDTGKPHYGSVVNAERFYVLATVFNAGIEAVDLDWSDYTLFAPCDIHYEHDLLRRLTAHGVDIVSPLVFQSGRFYDIWAFSRDGQGLPPFPEGEQGDTLGAGLVEMTTVGGVMLTDAAVLRAGVRYQPDRTRFDYVDRGYCEQARSLGFRVWCDPTISVYHGTKP